MTFFRKKISAKFVAAPREFLPVAPMDNLFRTHLGGFH